MDQKNETIVESKTEQLITPTKTNNNKKLLIISGLVGLLVLCICCAVVLFIMTSTNSTTGNSEGSKPLASITEAQKLTTTTSTIEKITPTTSDILTPTTISPTSEIVTPTTAVTTSWESPFQAFDCPADGIALKVPGNFLTIQEAINNAENGDSIKIAAGTYHENLILKSNVCLIGDSLGSVILVGDHTGPVITAANDTAFANLQIQSPITEADVSFWMYATGVYIPSGARVSIVNNIFSNIHSGIMANANSRAFIQNNTFNCQGNKYGISLTNNQGVVYRNVFDKCIMPTYLYGVTGGVLENEITGGAFGISTYQNSSLTISKNKFKNQTTACINKSQTGTDKVLDDNEYGTCPTKTTTNTAL